MVLPDRYHQEGSTLPKNSPFCPPDLEKLSVCDPRALRPLPTPSKGSCQSTSALGKAVNLPFCTTNTEEPQGLPDHGDSLSEIPFKCNGNRNELYLGNSSLASPSQSNPNLEKKESELHLYIISTTSSIFLHLKSSWNNYIIASVLIN
ncbi:hypothetical protein MC885_009294 [Smutsia gigantea]|nr:hypothetical protein MC885_009294 [Smutsia gigantea]